MPLPDAAPLGTLGQVDTLYLDPAEALAQARLGARVPMPGTTTGLQVCWYLSDRDIPNAPVNCARLPTTGGEHPVANHLALTGLRWPEAIRFPANFPQGEERDKFRKMMDWAIANALTIHTRLVEDNVKRIHADFKPRQPGEPIRVMGLASRITTVTQYVMQAWLNGFKRLGHEARIIIEPDDMTRVTKWILSKEIADFSPHLILFTNHYNFSELPLPEGMVHAIWWQDLMPQLTAGDPIPWRERDLVYLIMPGLGFKSALLKTGLAPERIKIQSLIVDDTIFNSTGAEKRERKIVFVGVNAIPETAAQLAAARELEMRLDNGERLTLADVNLAAHKEAPANDNAFVRMAVLHGAIRRHAVKMLCRQRKIPVEIWGRFWEGEPEVWPFLKGEVRHGVELANLYRSATHGFSVHPEIINHSRLAEIDGCGCIPIVYDVRHVAEPPFWENHVRYFHDEDTLKRALTGDVKRKPDKPILNHLSNISFASRVLTEAAQWL